MKNYLKLFTAFLLAFVATIAIGDSADWSKPTVGSNYLNVPSEIKAIAKSAAMMSYTGDTNIPTGALKFDPTPGTISKYNGATWDAQQLSGFKAGSVGTTEIVDGSVGTNDLATNAVTTAKILDANVTSAKLASTWGSESSTTLLPTGSMTTTSVVSNNHYVTITPILDYVYLDYDFTVGGTPNSEIAVGIAFPMAAGIAAAGQTMSCHTEFGSTREVALGQIYAAGVMRVIKATAWTAGANRKFKCNGLLYHP